MVVAERAVDSPTTGAPATAAASDTSGANVATPPVAVANGANGVDTPEVPESVEPKGSVTEYKRLEEHWDREAGSYVLRESAPPPPRKEKVDKFGQFCFNIVVRMHEKTGMPMWTMVEIKSSALRDVCRRVIGHLDGISWNSSQLRIEPLVFFRFYYRLKDRLQALRTDDPDSMAASHLALLLDFIRTEYTARFEEFEEITARGEITFALLDCILLPGTVLYTTCATTGEPRACRLVSVDYVPSQYQNPAYWNIKAAYVEATGQRGDADPHFGHSTLSRRVVDFNGIAKIHTLGVYPLKWHPREAEVRAQLVARGRVWEALDGVFHKRYDGLAHTGARRVIVNSRIMVDRNLYDSMSNDSAPHVVQQDDYYYDGYDSDAEAETDDYTFPNPYSLLSRLSDDDLLMCPALVYGFSLEDKRWLAFNVLQITEIKWNEEAFERLVLPEEQKDLIKGLVEAQATNGVNFDDFIEGKGRGLVINLFGPPGVGKTLSAEATSEHLRRPLYVVGAGDLGTSPSRLDGALTGIFKVGAAWGAVVLIDEADVYLEQRSTHDLERNALVAVFLRQLEYFAGLLFLTTNRVRAFDEAFQSRIHVSLRYRELDAPARRRVWQGFLEKLGVPRDQLSADEETALVVRPLNGRQIKNAVRTAGAMAASRKEPVAYKHIKGVVDIMQQFEKDFEELNVRD